MNDKTPIIDQHLAQLVISLQMGAMQQLGKVANPITGTVERDLQIAKATIDLVGMLEQKMAGNLTDDEQTLIKRILTELRMNYVDEAKKDEAKKDEAKKDEAAPTDVPDSEEPAADSETGAGGEES